MKKDNGQSLFEVVLALAVATLIVVALVALASSSIRNTTFSKNKTLATRYSQEAAEWMRGERDADWTTFYGRAANPLYCLKSLSWTEATIGSCGTGQEILNTAFKREVSFTRTTVTVGGMPKDVVEAEIKVYWSDAQGMHEVRTATDFTDWRQQL
jgi:Tfp pilus assembly protein PilV